MRRQASWVAFWVIGAGLFIGAVAQMKSLPARFISLEMATAMPRFVQVMMSGGDRWLAANVNVFRTLMVAGRNIPKAALEVQGRVQADAAWLNPAHEDNYYVAAAALPWGGQLKAADEVLLKAIKARPYDYMPAFFHGFDQYYFAHDPIEGARYMSIAADRADAENGHALKLIAARWLEKGNRPEEAMSMLKGMMAVTRSEAMKHQLQQRITVLSQLLQLREAATQYRERYGRGPRDFNELVTVGLLPKLPQNPEGFLFQLDNNGLPVLSSLSSRPKAR